MNLIKVLILLFFPIQLFSETSEFWGPPFILGEDWVIEFREKNVVTKYLVAETDGCGGFEGKYRKPTLNSYEFFDLVEPCSKKTVRKINCTILSDSDSPLFLEKLSCDDKSFFYNHLKRVPRGLERKINNQKVITMGPTQAAVVSNLFLREQPDIKSKSYKCTFNHYGEEDGIQGDFDFIPKGITLNIIARTTEKEQIKDKYDYWFYVAPLTDPYNGCGDGKKYTASQGWVFGAYMKFITP